MYKGIVRRHRTSILVEKKAKTRQFRVSRVNGKRPGPAIRAIAINTSMTTTVKTNYGDVIGEIMERGSGGPTVIRTPWGGLLVKSDLDGVFR